ncbi:hypothetical protein CYLTODRAFT_445664 [Cylindrobasidium torrendii FP15055 ss-10]|uniref:F-box domain-containing protein n=1 Tax=Cylindrobasidium torrendii FP15055 ss-10 TaxID=1314674 RepID=A0A0D7B439_9AGAR|nr:hypothetical protein CYLTODRAFT_445664 [Cylindrobasidium torrendii FP15055 ss-10]
MNTTQLRYGRRTRGSKGSLLQDVPYDIFLEICLHCTPLDLLNMTRVSKDLRAVLMHKSLAYIWQAARHNHHDMPPPWGAMSEPAWASICFKNICTVCYKKIVQNPNFELNCRICPGCMEEKTASLHEIHRLTFKGTGTSETLKGVQSIFELLPSSRNKERTKIVLLDHYNALVTAKQRVGARWPEMQTLKVRDLEAFKSHVAACKKWANICNKQRYVELDDKRSLRRTQIQEKLVELGYGEALSRLGEIHMQYQWKDHKLVRGTAKLTAGGWEKIKDEMIDFAQEAVDKLAERDGALQEFERQATLRDMLADWKRGLPNYGARPLPSIADLLEFDCVQEVIKQDTDVAVSRLDFKEALGDMADIANEWREESLNAVADHLGVSGRISVLNLARNAMVCDVCLERQRKMILNELPRRAKKKAALTIKGLVASPLWYTDIFSHKCAVFAEDDLTDPFSAVEKYGSHVPRSPVLDMGDKNFRERHAFKADALVRSTEMRTFAKMIITAAGMDFNTATVEDMDSLRVLFECRKCSQTPFEDRYDFIYIPDFDEERIPKARLLLNWRHWMEHAYKRHQENPAEAQKLLIVYPYDALTVPSLDDYICERTELREHMYACTRCFDMPTEWIGGQSGEDIIEHFAKVHSIKRSLVEGKDFVRAYGSPTTERFRQILYVHNALKKAQGAESRRPAKGLSSKSRLGKLQERHGLVEVKQGKDFYGCFY